MGAQSVGIEFSPMSETLSPACILNFTKNVFSFTQTCLLLQTYLLKNFENFQEQPLLSFWPFHNLTKLLYINFRCHAFFSY